MATLTVYPAVGANSPIDARMYAQDLSGMTIVQVASATGVFSTDTVNVDRVWALKGDGNTDQFEDASRALFGFDISALSAETIDAVKFSLYGGAAGDAKDDLNTGASDNSKYVVVDGTPGNEASVANSDFQILGSTDFGRGPKLDDWSLVAYNDVVLNASGIAHAETNKAGNVFYGTRVAFEFDGTIVGLTWGGNLISRIFAFHADEGGTDKDPKLVLTYTPSNLANLKTLDTIAIANIKTIDGVAIGNIKTWNTVS